jgi:hypothetical protein
MWKINGSGMNCGNNIMRAGKRKQITGNDNLVWKL